MLIALIIVAMVALAILELWLFWTLGDHQDRRRPAQRWPPSPPAAPADLSPGPDQGDPVSDTPPCAGTPAVEPRDHASKQSSAPTTSPACHSRL